MDNTFVLTEPILPTKPTKLSLPPAKGSKGSEISNFTRGLTLLRYYDVASKNASNISARSVPSDVAAIVQTGQVQDRSVFGHPRQLPLITSPRVSTSKSVSQPISSSTAVVRPAKHTLVPRVNDESIGLFHPMSRQTRRIRDSEVVINLFETTSPHRLTAPPGKEFFPLLESGDFFLNAIEPSPSDANGNQFQVWIFDIKEGQETWKPLAWGDLVNGRHVVITKKGNDISLIAPTTFQKRYKEARIVM